MAYTMGVVVGILVTIAAMVLIVFAIFKLGNKDGRVKTEYDERQKIVIGEGYKYAFWTLAALLVVLQIAVELERDFSEASIIQSSLGPLTFALIIVSILVFCVYSIWNGAYWGLNSNKKNYIIIIAVIGVVNVFIGVAAIMSDGLVVNGALSGAFVNLTCGLLMAVVLGIAWIKDRIDKASDNEEGDE